MAKLVGNCTAFLCCSGESPIDVRDSTQAYYISQNTDMDHLATEETPLSESGALEVGVCLLITIYPLNLSNT